MKQALNILEDVKILAFTQFLFGPATVQYLADMGADVIKVEPPRTPFERSWSGGDTFLNGESVFYLLAHRNIRCITLNLKNEDGIEAAKRLVANADVVIQNYRPGVLERLGLGYDELAKLRPDVIYASGSGYGTDTPYRHLPGQDLILQALTGLAAATGRADTPPTAAGAAIVDQHAASLLAMGILGALYHRVQTGEGQQVDVNMVQAALDLQMEPVVYHINGGTVERPQESLGSAFHEAPYGFYATRDGYIALSLSPVRLVAQALYVTEEFQEFEDPTVAFSRREEIHRAIAPLVADQPTKQLVERFRQYGVWCSPVNDYDATFNDPIVEEVDPLVEMWHPVAGKVRVLKHPVRYGSGEMSVRRTPPSHGEHTDEVLGEIGYSDSDVAELRKGGAV